MKDFSLLNFPFCCFSPRQGEPLLLDIEIRLASFDSISEVDMDYTLTLYLNQYWRDDRLIFGNRSEELTLTGEIIDRFWLPDTFFPNDKSAYLHDVTEKNKMIRLNGQGEILYGMRFTSTLACMMDLRRYPLDRQNCTVEVESYGYTRADVIMRWKNGRASVLDIDKVQLPQFTMLNHDTISYELFLATGKTLVFNIDFALDFIRRLSTFIVEFCSSTKYRLFSFSNLFTIDSYRHAFLGQFLDKSRSNQCSCCFRYIETISEKEENLRHICVFFQALRPF